MIIMIDNVWDDATDWCKWLEWWGIMRIDIILQISVSDLLTKEIHMEGYCHSCFTPYPRTISRVAIATVTKITGWGHQ